MMANQTVCSRLEQRSTIKYLVTEMCKICEIYRRTCVCSEKHVLVEKMFTNGLNLDLPQRTWIEKTDYRVEQHADSPEKKVLCATINKEGHADSVLKHERNHHFWIPWENYNHKQRFLESSPLEIFISFIEWPSERFALWITEEKMFCLLSKNQ